MAKAQEEGTLGTLLTERWEQISRKAEQLAEAIPDEKFEWKPTADIRTCGEVIRHLAFWNHYLTDSLRSKKADDTLNELPRADYPTKGSALKALRESATNAAAAIREHQSPSSLKTTELVMTMIEHTSEHYGQLVVYGRLTGIIPPVSGS